MQFFQKIQLFNKKNYNNSRFSILYCLFFSLIFFLNYFSLQLLFHGSRTVHLIVIFFSIFHSLISIILIKNFFIKSQLKLIQEYKIKKILLLIKKNIGDFLIAFFLIIISFFAAHFYLSLLEKKNLFYLFYDSTAVFPNFIIHLKKEFTSFFFSLSILISYFIFRLFKINQIISVILSIVFLTSPQHIYHLVPSPFRDYFSKTIILFIVLVSFLLLKKVNNKFFKFLVLFTTIILGFGMYIRQDLIIIFFIFIFSIIFFQFDKKTLLNKNFFFLIISLIFILLQSVLRFGNVDGNLLSGLTSITEENFFLNRSTYDFGYIFNDNYNLIVSILDNNLFLKIFLNFPVDFLMKIISSTIEILNLPTSYIFNYTHDKETKILILFYEYRYLVTSFFKGNAIIVIFAIFIITLIYKNIAQGCAFFLIFLTLLTYPILNFHSRHYFYLEIIPLLSIGFFFQIIINFLFSSKKLLKFFFNKKIIKVFLFFLLFIFLVFFLILVGRTYQKFNFEKILYLLSNIEKKELQTLKSKFQNQILFKINSDDLFKNTSYNHSIFGLYAKVEHIVLELDFNSCQLETVWPILRYKSVEKSLDFTRSLRINATDILVKDSIIIFPVYSLATEVKNNQRSNLLIKTEFTGIEFNILEQSCFKKVYKLSRYPRRLPNSLTILGYNYKPYFQFYSTSKNFYELPLNTKNKIDQNIENYTFESLNFLEAGYKHSDFDVSSLKSKILINSGNIKNNYCKNRTAYVKNTELAYRVVKEFYFMKVPCLNDSDLLWTESKRKNKGDIFFLQGEVLNGGIRVGFIGQRENRGYVQVTKKGHFKIFIQLPEDDYYNFGISNYVSLYSNKNNSIIIENIGWLNKKIIK
jgi:hypothetical protein